MSHSLTTAEITTVFTEGLQKHRGRVTEVFDDGRRLFMRSLLPHRDEVLPKDQMHGGLALSANEEEICLHPYLFRQVCRNGAIIAQSVASCSVEHSEFATADDVTRSLQKAIDLCSEQEIFAENVGNVKATVQSSIDHALHLAPMLSHLRGRASSREILQIIERFIAGRERTVFSMMNAITSVARDTRDPERKWRLEELGGGVGAMILPVQPEDFDDCEIEIDETMEIASNAKLSEVL